MPPITIEERVRAGAATLQELQDLGAERVGEIKSDGDHTHYRGSSFVALKAADAGDRKVLRLIASTDDKDHYGDRVSVRGARGGKGWQLDAYNKQGGVYLWAHNMGSVKAPIGQALKTWTGKIGKAAEGMKASGLDPNKMALMQDVEFLSADDGPDDHFKFAETIYLLMSGKGTRSGKGMMGSSVGFVPQKVYVPKTADEREKLGLGDFGVGHDEQTLLENSATPTPANPFASVIGRKSASLKSIEATVLEELDYMESEGIHDPALLKLFRERGILGPTDAEEKLKARLHSRVFMSPDCESDGSAKSTDNSLDFAIELDALSADGLSKALTDAAHQMAVETCEKSGELEEPADRDEISEEKALEAGLKFEADALHIDERAREILERAFQAADFANAALGVVLDAIDSKTTDPDFESSFGESSVSEEISERFDKLEAKLDAFLSSGAKTTARTDHDEQKTQQLTDSVAALIAATLKGN